MNWNTEPIGVYNHGNRIGIASEANLMCLSTDLYGGIEDLTTHEWAHPVDITFREINNTYKSKVEAAYTHAMANNIFTNTYGATNSLEYFAECVQMYYNVAAEGAVGGDGNHNEIDTRIELQSYDTMAYKILLEYYNPSENVPVCN